MHSTNSTRFDAPLLPASRVGSLRDPSSPRETKPKILVSFEESFRAALAQARIDVESNRLFNSQFYE